MLVINNKVDDNRFLYDIYRLIVGPLIHMSCAIFVLDRYYSFTVRDALLGERFALYKFNSWVTCLLLVAR